MFKARIINPNFTEAADCNVLSSESRVKLASTMSNRDKRLSFLKSGIINVSDCKSETTTGTDHIFGNNLINSELKIANSIPESCWRHAGELFKCPVEGYPVAETGVGCYLVDGIAGCFFLRHDFYGLFNPVFVKESVEIFSGTMVYGL